MRWPGGRSRPAVLLHVGVGLGAAWREAQRPLDAPEDVRLELLAEFRRIFPILHRVGFVPEIFAVAQRRLENAPLARHAAPRNRRVAELRGILRVVAQTQWRA